MNDRIPSRGEVDRTLSGLKTHQSAIVRHRAHLLARELERLRQDNEHLRAEKALVWNSITEPTTEKSPDAT